MHRSFRQPEGGSVRSQIVTTFYGGPLRRSFAWIQEHLLHRVATSLPESRWQTDLPVLTLDAVSGSTRKPQLETKS
jgi:hypothetical protein